MSLFKEFKALWPDIDQSAYQPGFPTDLISPEKAEEVIKFCREQLAQFQPRDDYRQGLELIILSLGGDKGTITFKEPPPEHHARWMSKLSYPFQIYLFRAFIVLTDAEMKGILMLCQFLVLIYVKYWYTCHQPIDN